MRLLEGPTPELVPREPGDLTPERTHLGGEPFDLAEPDLDRLTARRRQVGLVDVLPMLPVMRPAMLGTPSWNKVA